MDNLLLKEVTGLVCPLDYYSPPPGFSDLPTALQYYILLFSAAIAFRAQVEKFCFFITQV